MGHKMSQGELDQNSGAKPDFSGMHPTAVGNFVLFSDFEMNSNKNFNFRQGCLNLTQQISGLKWN